MPPLSDESRHIRSDWKVGSLNVELWSYSDCKWYDAEIVNIETDGGEEWLELAVEELNLSKQVLRFSRECRPPGYPEEADDDTDDEEWESSETYEFDEEELEEEEFSSDEIDEEDWIEDGAEVVVIVLRAHYAKCNGKYIQSGFHNGQPVWMKKDDENYMLKRNERRCWEIVEIDGDEEVILYDTPSKTFQPPISNWEKVAADWPAPGLQFKYIEPELQEINPDELVDEFKDGYKTFDFTIDERPFGVRFAHSKDEMFLIVDLVGSGTPGEAKGVHARDVLETINGEKYENSKDALSLWRSLELPFPATFKREQPKMQVLQVVRGGFPGLNGYFSLAGVCDETGVEQYFKSDDDSFKIVCTNRLREGDAIENEDGEEEEIHEDADEWCFFKEMIMEGGENLGDEEGEEEVQAAEDPEPEEHEIYRANDIRCEGFPPAYGWDVEDEEVAELPGPGVIRHTVYPKPPKRTRITKVEIGINQCTIYFDTKKPPIPEAAPFMTYHYKVFPYPKLPGQPEVITTLESPVVFPGLKNGQDYTFKIKAENQIFLASLSKESPVSRPLSLPTAKIKKLEGGDCKITVHFDDLLAKAADMMVSGWKIVTEPPTKEVKGTKSPVVFDGLENGVTYKFILTAKNAVGEAQDIKEATPLKTPPRPVIRKVEGGGILTRNKELRGLHIHCKVFVDCPGYDDELIRSYVVIESIPESYKVKVTDISKPVIIPDLINGQNYKFKATAVNSTARVASEWSKVCEPTGPPRTPKIIRVEPRISGALIHFECEDKAVPEYKCMYKIRANLKIGKLEVTDSPVYVPNLVNGKDYRLQVRSQNKISIEVPSRWSKKVYPVAWPPTPTAATITKTTSDYTRIEWKCNPKVTGTLYRGWYEVKTIPETVTLQVTKCKAKLKGLDPNVEYQFTVVACNAVGRSDQEPYKVDRDLSINQYWNPQGSRKLFKMGKGKATSSVRDKAAAFSGRKKRNDPPISQILPAPMRPNPRKVSSKTRSIQDKINSINSKLGSSASKLYKSHQSPTVSAPKPPPKQRTWGAAKTAKKPPPVHHKNVPAPPKGGHGHHRKQAPPPPIVHKQRPAGPPPSTKKTHHHHVGFQQGPPAKALPAPPTRKKTTHNLLAMARHQHNKGLAKPPKPKKKPPRKDDSNHMSAPDLSARQRAPSRGVFGRRRGLKKQKTLGNVNEVASKLNIFDHSKKSKKHRG